MLRPRLVLIGVLIVADLAILFGTPFLETVGDVPRSLGRAVADFDTDPVAAALPLVRLLLGAALLAAILDQVRGYLRRPPPAVPASEPEGWTDVRVPHRTQTLLPASMAVRDRWHDLPAWTWVGPNGVRDVQVGDTTWQVDRFRVTVESRIDFDEALRRIEVHDAFRQFADDVADVERRRAVIMALSAGQHWPFLGRSAFGLSTTRITAAGMSALDGVFVLRSQEDQDVRNAARDALAYLVAPTTSATRLVERDPDLVVALADQLAPAADAGDDPELHRILAAALARVAPDRPTGAFAGMALSPPSQEAVFRIQPAGGAQSGRANTRDHRYIVSVAKIDRVYLSVRTPTGIPVGTSFRQVTASVVTTDRPAGQPEPRSDPDPDPPESDPPEPRPGDRPP